MINGVGVFGVFGQVAVLIPARIVGAVGIVDLKVTNARFGQATGPQTLSPELRIREGLLPRTWRRRRPRHGSSSISIRRSIGIEGFGAWHWNPQVLDCDILATK